ncbi:hypothetical protein GOBAR_DD16397 [Gossypium barbadense]|nr:hypothetical protein GOBAR_DD16397 [Gossypium barbadense]
MAEDGGGDSSRRVFHGRTKFLAEGLLNGDEDFEFLERHHKHLTVQPWTSKFSPLQAFPRSSMVWVRLPGLPGFLYKRQILEEIESLIGTLAKLDFQIDKGSRGKFARMVMCVNLGKPLVSQILVNGVVQWVEFESFGPWMFVEITQGRVKILT